MSLKSFHIVFAIVTTGLFIFLTGFYGYQYFGSEESKHAIFAVVNLILTFGCIFYCKNFIEKNKSLSNL